MSAPFSFKQFTISQNHAPMKVGTDGVLLGGWCRCENAVTALDIGTGTGLIALMLAQRNSKIAITAIEPNELAIKDAKLNFENSPWNERIVLENTNLESFKTNKTFDLIISNPPFFKNSLHAPDSGRNLARHITGFSPRLFAEASTLLNANGTLSGVYPLDVFHEFDLQARKLGLFPARLCEVQPTPQKPPHRMLFEYTFAAPTHPLSVEKPNPIIDKLIIEENGRHNYSDEYRNLTRDFYLSS